MSEPTGSWNPPPHAGDGDGERPQISIVIPVAALLRHIGRVRDGQLTATVDPAGPRDLRQLGEGLNEMVGALAAAREHLGSLDHVTRVVRLGVFIATSGDFFDQPHVADAASDLFRDVFGADNMAVRLVIGVASLPLGMPIELDVIFEVAE